MRTLGGQTPRPRSREWGDALLLELSTALANVLGACPAVIGAVGILAIESRGVCWNAITQIGAAEGPERPHSDARRSVAAHGGGL